jgi:hypothetical protein
MKKNVTKILLLLCLLNLTSCYVNTHVVGSGAKGNEIVKKKSWYVLGNRVQEADTKAMAAGANDYSIDTRFNFVDYLINSLTFGVVNARTVTVKK